MKRKIFGCEISQKSKSQYFDATALVRAGNKWRTLNGLDFFRFDRWLQRKDVKEFIESLRHEYSEEKIIISGRGRGNHTWVHPFLFIDLALAINTKLKVEVYSWIYDELIKNRNDSGDSYKKLTGALYLNQKNKSEFQDEIKKTANRIKAACKAEDWQTATEKQLELRDKIHNNVALLCNVLRDNEMAVTIGIEQSKRGL